MVLMLAMTTQASIGIDPNVAIVLDAGNTSFTRVDAYLWVDANAQKDPLQEILDAVAGGQLQPVLSQTHQNVPISTAFVTPPAFVPQVLSDFLKNLVGTK